MKEINLNGFKRKCSMKNFLPEKLKVNKD